MSHVRETVKWGFAHVLQTFAYVDYHENMRVLLQPVVKYYAIAVLLTNAHTCIYSSETSQYFQCDPPTLVCYFQGEQWADDHVVGLQLDHPIVSNDFDPDDGGGLM